MSSMFKMKAKDFSIYFFVYPWNVNANVCITVPLFTLSLKHIFVVLSLGNMVIPNHMKEVPNLRRSHYDWLEKNQLLYNQVVLAVQGTPLGSYSSIHHTELSRHV